MALADDQFLIGIGSSPYGNSMVAIRAVLIRGQHDLRKSIFLKVDTDRRRRVDDHLIPIQIFAVYCSMQILSALDVIFW